MEGIKPKRDVSLDVARGMAIALVVFLHVFESYTYDWPTVTHNWYWVGIHQFAMPLFIFISGYLAYAKLDLKMIQRRAWQLLPPYLVWSIIYYFVFSYVIQLFHLRSNLFKNLAYDIWTLNPSSFWFFPVLLALCVILYLTRGKLWLTLLTLLGFYGLSQVPWPGSVGGIHIPDTHWFSALAWFLPFFALGYFIAKYKEKLYRLRYIKWACLAAFPVFFILAGNLNYNELIHSWASVSMSGWYIGAGFYMFGMGLVGIGAALAVSDLIARVAGVRWVFQYLGAISLGVFCTHSLFRTIGFGSGLGRVFLTTLIDLVLSAALVWVLQKSRITNFLLLGGGLKSLQRKTTPDKPRLVKAQKEHEPG
ncbi:MAG: acyltransferase family protein [Dehalococcoidales bacterium]|jgi:fucose 4-O-acetylase-like acetyltransferase